jgi:Putative Actinobacterial Holin-X, holin superfamily III
MAHVTSARDNSTGDGLPRVPSIPLSDEAAFDPHGNASIGNLVKEATTHLSTLVRAEIELAKTELGRELKKGLISSAFFIVALGVLLYSSFFFFFFLADLLDIWLPRAAASGIVFGLMLIVAVLAALIGYVRVRKIRAPRRTIDSLKDTAAALTHRGEPGTEVSPEITGKAGTAPRST